VQSVGYQAVQDICQRIEKAYQLFFKHNKKKLDHQDLKMSKSTNYSQLKPVQGTSFWVEVG
jgi:putative transposase